MHCRIYISMVMLLFKMWFDKELGTLSRLLDISRIRTLPSAKNLAGVQRKLNDERIISAPVRAHMISITRHLYSCHYTPTTTTTLKCSVFNHAKLYTALKLVIHFESRENFYVKKVNHMNLNYYFNQNTNKVEKILDNWT